MNALKLFAIFTFLLFLDQVTKGLASSIVLNSGFFLSSFTWSSPFYRIFCTLGLLSVCLMIITFVQFLTMKRAPRFCLALVIFEAGLVGNGMDRIRLGAVRDFIEVSIFHPALILNIADIYQWIAAIVLLAVLWKDPGNLWPEKNQRGAVLIYPQSQMRIVLASVLILILVSLSNLIFFFAYFKTTGTPFPGEELVYSFLVFTLLFSVIISIFSLVWSHRVYGPFRAVVRYLTQLKSSERFEVHTRKSDELECAGEILALIKDLEEMRGKKP